MFCRANTESAFGEYIGYTIGSDRRLRWLPHARLFYLLYLQNNKAEEPINVENNEAGRRRAQLCRGPSQWNVLLSNIKKCFNKISYSAQLCHVCVSHSFFILLRSSTKRTHPTGSPRNNYSTKYFTANINYLSCAPNR